MGSDHGYWKMHTYSSRIEMNAGCFSRSRSAAYSIVKQTQPLLYILRIWHFIEKANFELSLVLVEMSKTKQSIICLYISVLLLIVLASFMALSTGVNAKSIISVNFNVSN